MKIKTTLTLSFIFGFNVTFSQSDFSLEDVNPNSETFGQLIGPGDYEGNICIIFFGHEY